MLRSKNEIIGSPTLENAKAISVFGFWLHPHTNHKDFFTPRHFWIPHFPHTIIHKLPQICARIISFMDVPMAWPTFNQRHLDGFVRQAARRRADCAHGKP